MKIWNSIRPRPTSAEPGGKTMRWQKPQVCEVCVGMEVTAYLPADF
ncbi:pyrroloquinoline quinone precursor peptide PqqA [Xanthobacter albus]